MFAPNLLITNTREINPDFDETLVGVDRASWDFWRKGKKESRNGDAVGKYFLRFRERSTATVVVVVIE